MARVAGLEGRCPPAGLTVSRAGTAPVLGVAVLAALSLAAGARAARLVPAVPGAAAVAIAAASPGDTLVLAAGVHRGPLKLTTPVTLRGEPGAIVDGGGHGSVIATAAAGTVIEDLEVRASGRDVMNVDAGVQVLDCPNVTVRRVRARDVLYGVYGERAEALAVEACRLTGRVAPMQETGEGNGIHLWYCQHARVVGDTVDHFLDAVYLSFTNETVVEGDLLQWNGRYGLHTMYCQDNHLTRNRFTFNVAGCAIMFSNHLEVERNDFLHNRGARTYGLLLRDCSDGRFERNRLADNTVAVFLDGSNRNRFRGNLVQDNGWGLFMFSSCDGNEVAGNNFIHNDYPVALDMRRTDNRFDDGRAGNYWSEATPYDLDADGLSDVPYSPVSAFAFVSKQYPDLTILAQSPAVAALGVAERVFPALRPSEAVDRHPLVTPVASSRGGLAPDAARGPGRAWGPLAGFVALAGVGLSGMTLRRGR